MALGIRLPRIIHAWVCPFTTRQIIRLKFQRRQRRLGPDTTWNADLVRFRMAGFVRTFFISISLVGSLWARSYLVDGLVLSVSPPSFTVAHRPIPGYMQAMTMAFQAATAKDLAPIRPGMRVRFELRDNIARAIRIVPVDEADMPAPATVPRVGEMAPNFRLTD